MAIQEPNDKTDTRQQGTSIRAAMVVFLITLLVLAGMGVYWLVIRV